MIKTTERELSGKICEWFNEQIKRGNYPFSSASNETSITADKTYFSDIVIWENRESNKAYSYLELKPPFGRKENLDTFRKKAITLGVTYAYTWDFQSLKVYLITNNEIILQASDAKPVLQKMEEWKRGDKQAEIKAYISMICNELVSINEKGRLKKFKPEKHFFISYIRDIVLELETVFESFLFQKYKLSKYKNIFNEYIAEQGITVTKDVFKLIANQRVYGLVTKIIFYLMIRRHFSQLPNILEKDTENIYASLDEAFKKAKQIDWQAIFEDDDIEQLGIPEEAAFILQQFLAHLKIYNFMDLPEDVLGEMFEEIIDPTRRHLLGQYFTRENLVDFIIATTVKNKDEIYIDPTCGSGTFLVRLYDRLQFLNSYHKKHEHLLDQIWGVDIAKFPSELSTINLFKKESGNFHNFPRVLRKDIFHFNSNDIVKFPPTTAGKNRTYNKIEIQVPEFQSIVGNFPYIRQELIEKNKKGYKQELTYLLAKKFLKSYPDLFTFSDLNIKHLEELDNQNDKNQIKFLKNWVSNGKIKLKLSGQADIYAYLFIHATTLLKENGSIAVLTSNSWLDVSYGSILKQFLLAHFNIKMIVASWCEPWFDDAVVNTVFTVLEKCSDKKKRDENQVHFVKLKKKLIELIPHNLHDSTNRWLHIDQLIYRLENAENEAEPVTESIRSSENDEFRVRLLKQQTLQNELKKEANLSKWSKYLRAPDVYFEILEKCSDKLVPLKQVADVKRGITTGINEFFYLQPIEEKEKTYLCKNSRGWRGEIEKEYLKKVIKSPKESSTIEIDPKILKNLIFICNYSKEQLKKRQHLAALRYIKWGETQRTKGNTPWPEVPSVNGRKYWWGIKNYYPGKLLFQMINNQRFIVYINESRVKVDHNLFEFITNNDEFEEVMKIYFNSTLFSLIKENNSRINLGDGATKTEGIDWKNLMLVPKIFDIKNSNFKLFQRKILPIFQEVKKKDRQELDKAVLEALGLNPNEYLPRIYAGLTEMVQERLELPKMRKKSQKNKVKVSYETVKKSVVEEIISNYFRSFPEAFFIEAQFGKDYADVEKEIYNTSGNPLHYEQFMQICTVFDANDKQLFTIDSVEKAEYAKILAKPNVHRLEIPKDDQIVSIILSNYQRYLADLKKQLETNAQQKLHDWQEAERMTKEIMLEYGFIN